MTLQKGSQFKKFFQMKGEISVTDLQKEQIISMRKQNVPYSAISKALGISTNTLKTFCRRMGMTVSRTKGRLRCKNCGAKLMKKPKTKLRLFCSDKCKQIWWNKHRQERESPKITSKTCPVCGTVFTDYSSANRKYCSQKCYRNKGLIYDKNSNYITK